MASSCIRLCFARARACSYGSAAAQFKAFWDATGGLWKRGALVGKPATFFVSTASQGGGQETTHLTSACYQSYGLSSMLKEELVSVLALSDR